MPIGIYKRKPFTEEHKKNLAKVSVFQKGHKKFGTGMLGKKHTEKTKKKISLSKKGEKRSLETRVKISDSKKGTIPWNKGIRYQRIKEGIRYQRIKDRSLLKTGREKAYDTKYKYWMIEVKKRDKWKCKISNQSCKGRKESHHILSWRDYPNERYNINNGITLCQFHHPLRRIDEKKLIPFFQALVEV